MKDTKRAERRAERERLKAKRLRRPNWPYRPTHIDTPTPCSCHMCANKRGTHKGKERLTVQERKALAQAD